MRCCVAFVAVLCLFVFIDVASAQTIFPDQTGTTLLNSLSSTYRPTSVLNGDNARDRLYDTVDRATHDGDDGVVCIYTAYFVEFDCNPSCDPSQDVYNNGSGINLEHSWPQSQGANSGTAQWDLHHLFPTRVNVNSARGNMPFGDSPDVQTRNWYYLNQSQTTMPPVNERYLWSERGITFFEPRDEMKGDIARAMFYFYTMYGPYGTGQASTAFFDQMIDMLLQWHVQDPPTVAEVARGQRVAQFQTTQSGTPAINPYVVDATLASRAFGSSEASPEVFFAMPSANVLSADETVDVYVLSFAVTETSTVRIVDGGGTAETGVDYIFSESTLTFGPSTTEASVEIEVLNNPKLQESVTVVLEFADPSNDLGIGIPASFELTIFPEAAPPTEPLIAYWNFNNPGAGAGLPNSWPQPIVPTNGTGYISYTFDTAGVTNFGGSDINTRQNDGAGQALAIQGLTGGVNNGRYLEINVSTIGMKDIALSYATRGTGTGFDSQVAEFSVDGGMSWTFIDEETNSRNTAFFLVQYDLKAFGELNNQSHVTFRITLDGATSDAGNNRIDNIAVEGEPITTSSENQVEASTFGLESVWPNPIRDVGYVALSLGSTQEISLELFDVLGRGVQQIAQGEFSAGRHEIPFSTQSLANGIYLLRLTSANGVATRRITVIE